jgi:DNA-binding HxlR family transcriptional regulator
MMSKPNPRTARAGRFAYDGLDRVIHEKARLSVLTSLVAHPKGLVFGELKRLCALTDGNLSRHLQVLHEASLVDYLSVLEQVVRDAASAAKTGSAVVGSRDLKPA